MLVNFLKGDLITNCSVCKQKNITMGLALLMKPSTPKVVIVVHEAQLGNGSKYIRVQKEVVDRDSKDYVGCQLELK